MAGDFFASFSYRLNLKIQKKLMTAPCFKLPTPKEKEGNHFHHTKNSNMICLLFLYLYVNAWCIKKFEASYAIALHDCHQGRPYMIVIVFWSTPTFSTRFWIHLSLLDVGWSWKPWKISNCVRIRFSQNDINWVLPMQWYNFQISIRCGAATWFIFLFYFCIIIYKNYLGVQFDFSL